ncbi:MAG: HAMP domain-containing histidine kinase [Oscillospiraceae bacterium]|nr:HAMP domain-containing histidine kinase [Oscillospiraceae bacterium]
MKIFQNKAIRQLYAVIAGIMAAFLLLSQVIIWLLAERLSLLLLLLSLLASCGIMGICFRYFRDQNEVMEDAVSAIHAFLDGNNNARIACDEEGELYKLFHSVNTLAAVLNAHAEQAFQTREFLKDTISDISHQLKTPLTALNIYNGLLQDEAEGIPAVKELTDLSERELDRIETLVQNLLKITKLDAGAIVIEKAPENVAEIMKDIELHFAYRAEQEHKEITLSGSDADMLLCDRDWMIEAVGNLVKNALDHTSAGDRIQMEWKQAAGLTRITVRDDGSGIHPEDIHHIFKRFYRSRFSQNTQGIGLGLPLSKAIIEAHDGNLTVDSIWGQGSTFIISIPNLTEL